MPAGQAARDAVAADHKAGLGDRIALVGHAIDGFRAGKLDAFAPSAEELWKFWNLIPVEIAAETVVEEPAMGCAGAFGTQTAQLLAGETGSRGPPPVSLRRRLARPSPVATSLSAADRSLPGRAIRQPVEAA
jgi:hypothetical protein